MDPVRIDPADLLDSTEVADLLGVSSRHVVDVYQKRHADFPEPVVRKTRVRLWLRDDIVRWRRDHPAQR